MVRRGKAFAGMGRNFDVFRSAQKDAARRKNRSSQAYATVAFVTSLRVPVVLARARIKRRFRQSPARQKIAYAVLEYLRKNPTATRADVGPLCAQH